MLSFIRVFPAGWISKIDSVVAVGMRVSVTDIVPLGPVPVTLGFPVRSAPLMSGPIDITLNAIVACEAKDVAGELKFPTNSIPALPLTFVTGSTLMALAPGMVPMAEYAKWLKILSPDCKLAPSIKLARDCACACADGARKATNAREARVATILDMVFIGVLPFNGVCSKLLTKEDGGL